MLDPYFASITAPNDVLLRPQRKLDDGVVRLEPEEFASVI